MPEFEFDLLRDGWLRRPTVSYRAATRSRLFRVTPFGPFTPRHHDELDRGRADIERFLGRPVALEVEPGLLASEACVRSSIPRRARPVS